MLQLKDVCKSYTTADFTQVALDHVSLAFRDNEFVAILGPSGSGKTTMLNIIGGLDHYDSGDLLIDGISTKQYRDRDWDTYRNNRIGFVFQAYNLIPHQTILENVELALTLSGVSRTERREQACAALERVGLGEHINKKPSQLSGGQMQRVAIARALVNEPEIILADEPTGALDSKTSVQIMDLLTEIAGDRLVIMVTHNPELAEQYATRIVNLADGVIKSDTRPFDPDASNEPRREAKAARQTSMSFFTALSLSFKNLLTKKGRTLMTAFAGSIGIIGIAAILSLANGVNQYIANVEENTLSEYPLQIQDQGFDMTGMMTMGMGGAGDDDSAATTGAQTSDSGDSGKPVHESKMITGMFSSIGSNDLASLKEYFDNGGTDINSYVNSIEYGYSVTPQIFNSSTEDGVHQVNPDKSFASVGLGASSNGIMSSMMSTNIFYKLPANMNQVDSQYDVVAGHWPENYNEVVAVLTPNGNVSDFMLYSMGLRDHKELEEMVREFANEEEVEVPDSTLDLDYDDLMNVEFKLVNSADFYQYDSDYQVWKDKSGDADYMKSLVDNGETLKVCGVVKPKEGEKITSLSTGLYYSNDLINHLIDEAGDKQIVKDQQANPTTNVITGKSFAEEEDAAKDGNEFDMSSLFTIDGEKLQSAFTFDESALASGLSNADLSSSMDLSGANIDLSNMPAFDASGIQIDPSKIDMSQLNLDFSNIKLNLDGAQPDIKTDVLTQGIMNIMGAYPSWLQEQIEGDHPEYATDQKAAVEAYLADPATKAAMQKAIADSIDFSGVSEQIQQQLQEQLSVAMQSYMQSAMTQVMTQYGTAIQNQVSSAMTTYMSTLSANMSKAMGINENAFADAFQMNMSEQELSELMASLMSTEQSSYDNNMKKFGWADYAKPASIDIYPKDFESKQSVIDILDGYNDKMNAAGDEDKVVSYTDIVGALMSSVTTIVNMISYVLVAFVAISLVVSSIMIGIITYISVLERKKEIGILRSIGASKGDVSRIFNAETFIVGFTAGIIGIALTALACIPANAIVYSLFDVENVAILPWQAAIALVGISVLLTFLAGLIPSSAAAKKDPVEALRSE